MFLFSTALQSQFLQPYQLCFFGRVVWSAFWSVVLQSQFPKSYQLHLSWEKKKKTRRKLSSSAKPTMKKVLLVLHKHVLLGPFFWSFLQRKARDMEEFPKWNLSLKSIIQPKKAEMWVRTDKSFNVEIGQKVAERDNGMWLFSAALQSQFLQPYQLCLSFLSLEKPKKITSLVKPSLKTCRVAKNGRMVSNLVSHYIGSLYWAQTKSSWDPARQTW